MPKRKRRFGETCYDYEVRCGERFRDPLVLEALRLARIACVVAFVAVSISGAVVWFVLPL